MVQGNRVGRYPYRFFGRDDAPTASGVRLFNGREEQLMTVLLPNRFLTNDQQIRSEPAWGQLELWDRLRSEIPRPGVRSAGTGPVRASPEVETVDSVEKRSGHGGPSELLSRLNARQVWP
ncbi:DUF7676 family protein [[Mycobacterium] nativiensis]|uniref:DUF7676 family protein n=1 Tax=[Mycobacterium] nativiensis TaxID=2855503 RepID=UPI001CD57137|nr:hypothetical protein [Mycolicibacter sp. MYC340]